MTEDVKSCVLTRENFFEQYYTVPEDVKPEVQAFVAQLRALGEASSDAAAFESAFASNGLSDKFNSLLMKCTPKPITMTAEQQAYSKQVAKDLYKENGGNLAKDIASDAADTLAVEAKEELIAQSRKAMIKAGTFDDYTRASNMVEDAGILGGFVKKLFGKKK